MKTLKHIEYLEGVKVFLRADFNVGVMNGKVVDDYRIKVAFPTIDFLRSKGAKIILASHLETSEGEDATLLPIANHLNSLGLPVSFIKNIRNAAKEIERLKNGECVLLENLRTWPGEKANDPGFATELASLADIYVNDAFSVCHREHASIVGIPKLLPSYAGFQLEKEVENISKAFDPEHPFLFILCGAKFETKLPLLDKFMKTADLVFIGGALAHDFFKLKGYEIGTSLVSKGTVNLAPYADDPKLILPVDVTLQDSTVKDADKLGKEDNIVDVGPKTLELLRDRVAAAKFILWNGPLGIYEHGFKEPTLELARMIAGATRKNGAFSLVGGGDTLAAIHELRNHESFTFISTGGGAMLDFLAKGTLPGIQALEQSEL